MEADQKNIDTILYEAVEIASEEERDAYLDRVCGEDTPLRREAQRLVADHFEAGDFLEKAVVIPDATIDQQLTEKPGTHVGPYKLLQQLGEGGMGVVYKAEQKEPVTRPVALKIIKPGMDTRQVIARFEAERQALAMMDHPNIAKVLDAGATDSGRPYFVMELVNGLPVTEYCDEQHLTPKERLELFVPICQAVQHAHQKGIIHRDIKPSNILVALYDGRPVPKIIDFGVAKATSQTLTEKTMFTQLGQVVGTLEYMSPEQAQQNQVDIDTRSDIYSLGVVLYELLTGDTPFDRERLRSAAFDEMLRIIREEEPPKPSTKLSSSHTLPSVAANRKIEPAKLSSVVRGELDWIVMKALEKDRARRYETASKFAEDVQHYLNDEPVQACPPSREYRFRKFLRRNKTAVGMTAVVALALIVGVVGTTWQSILAALERDRAVAAEKLAESRLKSERTQRQRATEAEQKAQEEAAIAKAVNDFLQQDLLGMMDAKTQFGANLAPNPHIEVRTVLDRAAENIDGRFTGQPLIEAAIRTTIGKAYQDLGLFGQSEDQLRRAWQIRERELGADHLDTLDSLGNLALALKDLGRYAEAERQQRRILEFHLGAQGIQHPGSIRIMNQLAVTLNGLGRYAEAEELHRQALSASQSVNGPKARDTLWTMTLLSEVMVRQGKYADALGLVRTAFESLTETLGLQHPDTLACMSYLGEALHESGRYSEAESLYRRLLELDRRIRGPEHPHTLNHMSGLALALLGQRHDADAEDLLRRVLALQERQFGTRHPRTLFTRLNLGSSLSKQEHFKDAEASERLAFEIAQEVFGAQHPDTLLFMNNLGFTLSKQGKCVEAAEILIRCLDLELHVFPTTHPSIQLTLNNLSAASWRLSTGADNAQPDAELALKCAQKVISLRPENANDWDNLGVALCKNGRWNEAEEALAKARDMRGGNDPDHEFFLAMAHWSTGERDAAMDVFTRARNRITNGLSDPEQIRFWHEAERIFTPEGLEEYYTQKISSEPVQVDWLRHRALLREQRSQWDDAAADWARVIELTEDHGANHSPRKVLCREFAARPEMFQHMTELYPKNEVLWIGRGQYHALRNAWADAAASYAKAVAARPLIDESQFEYGGTLLLAGDQEGYQQFCNQLAGRAKGAHFWAGFVLARTCGIGPAKNVPTQQLIDWAKAAADHDPQAWTLHVLGMAYFRAGEYDLAIETLEKSNGSDWYDAGYAENWLILAMIYNQRNNTAEANRWYQRAQEVIDRITPEEPDQAAPVLPIEWIELELLRREAANLFETKPPSDASLDVTEQK